MPLENLVLDAVDPPSLGRFWGAALGLEVLTDTPSLYEGRLTVPDGPWLDLCLPQVPRVTRPAAPQWRLHLHLAGGREVVDRLLGMGATMLDDQPDLPMTGLADPEGNPFCVRDQVGAGLAAVPVDSSDPSRDAAFWAGLTGWQQDGATVRHPSGRGPAVELVPQRGPKDGKNRLHLDVRPDPGQDLVAVALTLGATRRHHDWGPLPWTVLVDPSGNELCVLPAHD